jgi:uncharacterized protein YjiS (DUF1127 family)
LWDKASGRKTYITPINPPGGRINPRRAEMAKISAASGAGVVARPQFAAPELMGNLMSAFLGWQDRWRQRQLLAEMDERMLHDMGIDRATVSREVMKPFWRG